MTALDQTMTLSAVGNMGYSIPVSIKAIVDAAVAQAVVQASAAVAAGLDLVNAKTLGVGANLLAQSGSVRAGRHAITQAEADAHTASIASGVTTLVGLAVQIIRAGDVLTGDAAVSFAAGAVVVADGAAVYVLTKDDVINWIAIGA